mmetsp:Transcript_10789/g.16570  ORF Transcript_10789/g.16570 Transcript_10789/m.16570 type:complete len:199 (+) Transcript_10789:188-784(+)
MRNYNLRGIYDTYDTTSRARRGLVNYLDDDGDSDEESEDDGFTKSFIYDEDGEADNRKKRKKKHGLLKKYFAFYKPTVEKSDTAQKQREDGFEYVTSDDDDREIKDIHYSLRYGSNVLSAVSLFFWCWAMKNTRGMEKGQDLGIYSFFFYLCEFSFNIVQDKKWPWRIHCCHHADACDSDYFTQFSISQLLFGSLLCI